jgi:hypothetical protein
MTKVLNSSTPGPFFLADIHLTVSNNNHHHRRKHFARCLRLESDGRNSTNRCRFFLFFRFFKKKLRIEISAHLGTDDGRVVWRADQTSTSHHNDLAMQQTAGHPCVAIIICLPVPPSLFMVVNAPWVPSLACAEKICAKDGRRSAPGHQTSTHRKKQEAVSSSFSIEMHTK